jgi:hypothetical protein
MYVGIKDFDEAAAKCQEGSWSERWEEPEESGK